MIAGVMAHVRARVVQGLLLLLPLVITVWLLSVVFSLIHDNVTPLVIALLEASGIEGIDRWPARLVAPISGVLLTLATIYLVGLLAANLAGRRVLYLVESLILRIPLVKGIYGSARQLLDAFGSSAGKAFSRVVLLEYPRKGVWTVGFVTAETRHRIAGTASDRSGDTVAVFLPTTPNPTSGWLALVPVEDLRELDLTIEEAVKFIVSGGIVAPSDLKNRFSGTEPPLPS